MDKRDGSVTTDHSGIRALVLRLDSRIEHLYKCGLLEALWNTESGALAQEIGTWYSIGYRRIDTMGIQDELLTHGIEPKQIAIDLNVNVSTISRWFSGTNSPRQWEILLSQYRHQLKNYQWRSIDDKFIGGSCYAITQLKEQLWPELQKQPPQQNSWVNSG